MPPIDYIALLTQEFEEYAGMLVRRQEVDLEIAQKEQFIRATINMLPEDKKLTWQRFLEGMSAGDVGLSDSIRNALKSAPRRFYTATEVKQMLVKRGFDFSKYTTNPLSSVHAALKRLKAEEAELNQIDGVMAWRWVKQPLARDPKETFQYDLRRAALKKSSLAISTHKLRTASVVDLMASLKKSLAEQEEKRKAAIQRFKEIKKE